MGRFGHFIGTGLMIVAPPLSLYSMSYIDEGFVRPSDLGVILQLVLLMTMTAVLSSLVAHLINRSFERAMFYSTVVTLVIYGASVLITFLTLPQWQMRLADSGWVETSLFFFIGYALPVVAGISYGVGRIVHQVSGNRRRLSQPIF
jgi:hypothetical protein